MTDILGASGQEMLRALAAGETDTARMADRARGRLRKKIPQLAAALEGVLSETQRWLLGEQLDEIARLDQALGRIEAKLEELYRPFDRQIERLRTVPGVHVQTARVIIAEIGVDMKRFSTANHLASWAGMCPGNRESGGKRQSGRSRPGNEWLRSALAEAGWAAARSKGTALGSFYQRIARRRGGKRACRAVGHQILLLAYRLLSNPDETFREPGPDYYDQRRKDQLANALLRKLRQLGVDVTVNDPAA